MYDHICGIQQQQHFRHTAVMSNCWEKVWVCVDVCVPTVHTWFKEPGSYNHLNMISNILTIVYIHTHTIAQASHNRLLEFLCCWMHTYLHTWFCKLPDRLTFFSYYAIWTVGGFVNCPIATAFFLVITPYERLVVCL